MEKRIKKNLAVLRPNVALDVDDVLFECNTYAVRLINEMGCEPPMSIEEIRTYAPRGDRSDRVFDFFESGEFFRTQPVISGAHEFVSKLSKIANVFISSAMVPDFMSIRARRILEEFPEIPQENIMLGSRKDMCRFDIILDDCGRHITESHAKYPILMRMPWNRYLTGCLSVNDLDEAYSLIENIIQGPSPMPLPKAENIVLVGPTGSGKGQVVDVLEKHGYVRPKMYTTDPWASEAGYRKVSEAEFLAIRDGSGFIESSVYAGHHYGITRDGLGTGRTVMVMDICGAMRMKKAIANTVTIFIRKERDQVIGNILDRDIPNDEKTRRIISLNDEYANASLCDYVIDMGPDTLVEIEEAFSKEE